MSPKDLSIASVMLRFAFQLCRSAGLATLVALSIHSSVQRLHAAWPYNTASFFAFTLGCIHLTLYVGLNSVFIAFDKYDILTQFKVPRLPGQIPSPELVRKTVLGIVANILFVDPFLMYYGWSLLEKNGIDPISAELPSPVTLLRMFAVNRIINEALFYWMHRLLHSRALYGAIHKKHHEYSGTIGFAAEYAHPLESILANSIPTVIGSVMQGVPVTVWLVWMAWRLEETYEAHSGYCFKDSLLDKVGLLHSSHAEFHDFHHSANKGNFGAGIEWDYLFGTMDPFLAAKSPAPTKKAQ